MRKNISLHAQIDERAEKIIRLRGFNGLSDLIAVLIREEYERKFPGAPVYPGGPAAALELNEGVSSGPGAGTMGNPGKFPEVLTADGDRESDGPGSGSAPAATHPAKPPVPPGSAPGKKPGSGGRAVRKHRVAKA